MPLPLAPPSAVPPWTPLDRIIPRRVANPTRSVWALSPPKRPNPQFLWKGTGSDPAVEDGPLDLLDGLGDLDVAGARVRAVERRAAPEHAGALVEDLEPLARRLVARVEDEAVGVDDRGGADIRLVAPVDGARRGAGRAQDALRGVVEAGPVFGALEPLGVAGVVVVNQLRHSRPVLLEERLHVDDEIFDDRKATNRLDGDVAPGLADQ